MTALWPILLALGHPSAPPLDFKALFPCEVGKETTFVIEGKEADPKAGFIERVASRTGNKCVLTRTYGDGRVEHHVYELGAKRVFYAGEKGAIRALQPVILKDPITLGAKWRYAKFKYRVAQTNVALDLPIGRLSRCAEIVQTGRQAGEVFSEWYCEGHGRVAIKAPKWRLVAAKAERRGKSGTSPKVPIKSN